MPEYKGDKPVVRFRGDQYLRQQKTGCQDYRILKQVHWAGSFTLQDIQERCVSPSALFFDHQKYLNLHNRHTSVTNRQHCFFLLPETGTAVSRLLFSI